MVMQIIGLAQKEDAQLVVDMRDGMFGDIGEDVFSRYFYSAHPNVVVEPDFKALLANPDFVKVPQEVVYFESKKKPEYEICYGYPWNRWFPIPFKKTPLQKKLGFIIQRVFGYDHLQNRHTRIKVCNTAFYIRMKNRKQRTIHLTMDYIRSTKWPEESMVWPRLWIRDEIERELLQMGFDSKEAVGIHVRQTDKTSNSWWKVWLKDLKEGKIHADRKQVFLATDSRKVLEAFQEADLNQTLFWNSWFDLPEKETPLHLSGFNGSVIIRSALFDMWVLSNCAEFIPYMKSSFSRVALAWRKFQPPEIEGE